MKQKITKAFETSSYIKIYLYAFLIILSLILSFWFFRNDVDKDSILLSHTETTTVQIDNSSKETTEANVIDETSTPEEPKVQPTQDNTSPSSEPEHPVVLEQPKTETTPKAEPVKPTTISAPSEDIPYAPEAMAYSNLELKTLIVKPGSTAGRLLNSPKDIAQMSQVSRILDRLDIGDQLFVKYDNGKIVYLMIKRKKTGSYDGQYIWQKDQNKYIFIK